MRKPSFLSVSSVLSRILLVISPLILTTSICIGQTANFSADITSGCFPLTVKFSDTSTGAISSWSWNFGNGNSSELQSPSAVYSSPGIYSVTLTVSNGLQTDTEIKTGYISVRGFPDVTFSYNPPAGCAPLAVKFTDKTNTSFGTITDWFWVFGDGGTSTEPNPTHVYTSSGNRSVSLKVRNQFGCEKTKVIESAITVQGPSVAFKASSTLVCQVPASIQFTNQSTGNGTLAYTWDFGDGETSTSESPTHTYTKPGSYTAKLSAKDTQGCESIHSVIINAGSEDGLNFTPSASKICLGEPITFTAQAKAPMLSRVWDFGNNTSSTELNPSFSYTSPGTYQVTLKALLQGNTCESVVTKTIEVLRLPKPDFTYTSDCNYKVTFNNTSQYATRYEWYVQGALSANTKSFTFPFSSSGDQAVRLIAFNDLNCSTTLDKTITIRAKPVAAFTPNLEQDCLAPSLSGCAPFVIQFKNTSSSPSSFTSEWTFGDGTTSVSQEPSHTYTNKGTYTLTLKIKDATGCISTRSATVTVSDVKPVAKFIADKTTVCAREDVKFSDQSQNATFWCWDFGDGSTSSGKDVSHSYTTPGIYTVTLTTKNGGCSDTYQITNAITVRDPYVDFKIEKNCSDPYTINLVNLSSNYTSLEWDFDDGITSNTNVSSHQYASVGEYEVRLTSKNTATNCITELVVPVLIQDVKADFEIDNPKPCKGALVNFKDKSESVSWREWTLGNNTTSNSLNAFTNYPDPGTYTVTLTTFDTDGCSDQKILPVTVLDIQGDFTFQGVSTCDELTVQFQDQSTGSPSLLAWAWDFGDGQTSIDTNPLHVYQNTGSYPVKLTLTNAEGNCSFIKSNAVNFTTPLPDFITAKPALCIDDPILITNMSMYANTFAWDFGDGRFSDATNPQIAYPVTGNYSVKLTATDSYGCEKSITKTNFISITKPVAGFDAFETSGECPPLTTIFQNKSTGSVKEWHWDFGNGLSSVLPDPANTYLKAGSFDVKLMVADINGCTDTTVVEKLVNVGGPAGSFSTDLSGDACLNKTVSFTANTTNTVTHRWDFGDGFVEDVPEMNTVHHYTAVGSVTASLVLFDDKGCKVVADGEMKITVNDTTKVDFDYSPKCIFEGEYFSLQALSTEDEMIWAWEIQGQPAGDGQEQEILIDTAGEHQVVLRAMNRYGCTSLISKVVPVHGNVTFIPNVFTPDSDDLNAVFEITDIEKSKWDLQIYNRWGKGAFSQDHYTNDWNGGDLSTGVYYYILTNSFCRERTYKGNVTIIR